MVFEVSHNHIYGHQRHLRNIKIVIRNDRGKMHDLDESYIPLLTKGDVTFPNIMHHIMNNGHQDFLFIPMVADRGSDISPVALVVVMTWFEDKILNPSIPHINPYRCGHMIN